MTIAANCKVCRKGGGAETSLLSITIAPCLFPADDHEVTITGTQSGLGIRIVGGQRASPGQEPQDQGIFVKEVIEGSLAERDGTPRQSIVGTTIDFLCGLVGRLKRGDQLVKANGVSLVGVSNER